MEKFPQQLRSVFHPGASGPHEMSPEASRVEMKPLRKPEVQAGGAPDKEVLEMLDSKAFDTVIPKKGLDGLWTINTCLPHSEKDWVTVYFAVLRCYVVRVVPELERAGGNSKVVCSPLARMQVSRCATRPVPHVVDPRLCMNQFGFHSSASLSEKRRQV